MMLGERVGTSFARGVARSLFYMEDPVGQAANSGRNANLDQKKERSEGRKQNDPARRQIAEREAPPQVKGAFGSDKEATEALDNEKPGS
jgi:hypothetical protein